MKRIGICIAVVFVALPALAFDCGREDLDPKLAALCAHSRGLVDMSAAALTTELGGPSGDPGPAHCAMIPRRDNLWRHYLDIVGGPNGPPANPWDWSPDRWCVGTWCIANASADPFAEEWHMGKPDQDGVRRGSAAAWLRNCAAEIWGGAELIPPGWFDRIDATERFVWQWVKYQPPLTPREIAAMVDAVDVPGSDRDGSYRCRTLPCVRLGLAAPIYPPQTVPAAHWRAFVGAVFWHLESPTPENVRRAMAHELTRRTEEELGWPNIPTWPDRGPMVTLWRAWSENPPPEPPDDCPCPGCVPCEREHCDDTQPRDVVLYDLQGAESPRAGDVPVVRPEIAPHEPAPELFVEMTIEFRSLPTRKGESVAFAYLVGDGGDRGPVILAAVRQVGRGGRQVLKVTTGAGCWVDAKCKPGEEPKEREQVRLAEPLRTSPDPATGDPVRYRMEMQRTAGKELVVTLYDESGTELTNVEMGPEAAVGPFHVSRADLGNDGKGLAHGELLTDGTIWSRATAGYQLP
jgi:hypothetical protein